MRDYVCVCDQLDQVWSILVHYVILSLVNHDTESTTRNLAMCTSCSTRERQSVEVGMCVYCQSL